MNESEVLHSVFLSDIIQLRYLLCNRKGIWGYMHNTVIITTSKLKSSYDDLVS